MIVPKMIQEIMEQTGWTQAEVAAKLGVEQATVSRWFKGSDPRGATRDAIRALHRSVMANRGLDSMDVAAGLDAPTLRSPNAAPVVGFAGAGAEIYAIDDHEKGGGLDEIEAPFPVHPSTVCVVVRGDSMLPVFEDGDLIGYSKEPSRDPAQLIGRRCLVKLADGRTFIKVLKRGSQKGLFTLVSFNAGDIEDVAVEWAAEYDFTLARGKWHYSKHT